MNTEYQITTANTSHIPPSRIVERKIGKSTFIVSSRFNDGKEKDLVSTMARLILYSGDGKKD